MDVISGQGLTKTFGRLKAVDGLSFNIEENRITGLIGPNGAGKTTLLKMIAGFMRVSSGEVLVFSENPFNNLKVSTNMIFVDENMKFSQSLSLSEIMVSASAFYKNWEPKLATGLLEYFSLDPGRRHNQLSKGMRSTFNMIIGLAARCPLTIFDEPTSGMDAGVRKDFYRALLRDYLQKPRSIIFSSHLLNEVEDLLEDILLLRQGQKRLHLPIPDLKEFAVALRGKKEVVADLLEGEEIFHQKSVGTEHSYTVIRRDRAELLLEEKKPLGVETLPVKAEDLCVYLTSQTRGGIDDVFDRK